MSSGIVLLNKTGVAVATDSAVTIGKRSAIFNSAQKTFEIGQAPVLIVNYGSGDFLNVPIDVIFKQFSQTMKNHQILKDHVADYAKEFWRFLEEKKVYFMFEKNDYYFFQSYVNAIISDLLDYIEFDGKPDDVFEAIKARSESIQTENKADTVARNNTDFSFSTAFKKYPELLNENYKRYIEKHHGRDFEKFPFDEFDKQILIIIETLSIQNTNIRYYFDDLCVGVCFAGFGEKDLYPSSHHFQLFGVIQGRTIYIEVDQDVIDDNNTRGIVKLAQTDVITTVIDGIHPKIKKTLFNTFENETYEFLDSKLKDNKHINLNELKEDFTKNVVDKIRRDWFSLTLDIWNNFEASITVLPIQDLAALAESLISLQSMKRKYEIDSSLNSTVGGPIDVAVITKNEGVKWIKNSKG